MSELKPCPFCGGEASADGQVKYHGKHDAFWSDRKRITKAHYVNCMKCGISNRGLLGHRTQAAAIAAWNRRAEKEEG